MASKRIIKCEHCNYEWTPRVKEPKSCPRCHRYRRPDLKAKELEVTPLGDDEAFCHLCAMRGEKLVKADVKILDNYYCLACAHETLNGLLTKMAS